MTQLRGRVFGTNMSKLSSRSVCVSGVCPVSIAIVRFWNIVLKILYLIWYSMIDLVIITKYWFNFGTD